MTRFSSLLAKHNQRNFVFGDAALRQGQYNFLRAKALRVNRNQPVALPEAQALVACLLQFELFPQSAFDDIAALYVLTWDDVDWQHQQVKGVKVSDVTLTLLYKWYEAIRLTAQENQCVYQPAMWLDVRLDGFGMETVQSSSRLLVTVAMKRFRACYDFSLQHAMWSLGLQWQRLIENAQYKKAEKQREAKRQAKRAAVAPKKQPAEPLKRLIPEPSTPPPIPEIPKLPPLPLSEFAARELGKLPESALVALKRQKENRAPAQTYSRRDGAHLIQYEVWANPAPPIEEHASLVPRVEIQTPMFFQCAGCCKTMPIEKLAMVWTSPEHEEYEYCARCEHVYQVNVARFGNFKTSQMFA